MNILRPPCDKGIITSKEASLPCEKKLEFWILAATILGSSMVFIDGTVVNIALPALQSYLNADSVDLQWVIESYALFLAALLLTGGSLGDLFGRKRIFAIGVALFAVSSAWCGLAPDVTQLIVARAVQGIGGALLVPGSLAIISASFAIEKRGQAIGTWSGSTAITTALGPVIGGWIIEHISWRAVFFLNLPLAAAVLFMIFLFIPESRNEEGARRVDYSGALTATVGMGAIIYGLIESQRSGFRNPAVIFALAGGIILFTMFIMIEEHKSNPMMPPALFKSRQFTGSNILTLFLYASLAGTLYFLPLNLIQVQLYTATAAGAAILPFILIMFFLSQWSGGLVKRYGSRFPLTIGPFIASAGFALLMFPNVCGNYWKTFFPAIVVLGLGMAVSVAPLTTTVMNSVKENRVGIASGVNNAVSRTAGLLAVAVMGLIMYHSFNSNLNNLLEGISMPQSATEILDSERIKLAAMKIPPDLPKETRKRVRQSIDESFIYGFRWVMLSGTILALMSSLTGLVMIRKEGNNCNHES